jgi:hypothetical protein
MIGVVIGNGPSKKAYDRTGDFVIGCNIPGNEFSVDATVICDEEIVWVLKSNPKLVQCPVIISTKAWEKMKELRIDHLFYIHHVFKPKEWYNTAHYAADYLLEYGAFDEIHIWGCDSIFEDHIASSTDDFVFKEDKTGDRFLKNWRRIWNEIFDAYPDVTFNAIRIEK